MADGAPAALDERAHAVRHGPAAHHEAGAAAIACLAATAAALGSAPWLYSGLGAASYGLLTLLGSLNGTWLGFGLGRGLTRELAAARARDDAAGARRLVSTAWLLACGAALLPALGLWYGRAALAAGLRVPAGTQEEFERALGWTLLGLPGGALLPVCAAIPQALRRFAAQAWLNAAGALALAVLGGALASAGAGLTWVVAAQCLWVGCWAAALAALGRHAWRAGVGPATPAADAARALLRFAWAGVAIQAVTQLLLLVERVWIVRLLGADRLPSYAVPLAAAAQFQALAAAATSVLVPRISGAWERHDRAGLERLYGVALRTTAAAAVLGAVLVLALRRPLLSVWLGPAFAAEAHTVLALHFVAFALLAVASVPWHAAEGLGRPGANVALQAAIVALALPGCIAWTADWGVHGPALARLLALLALPFHVVWLERRLLGHTQVALWRRTIVALAPCAGAAWLAAQATLQALAAQTPPTGRGLLALQAGLAVAAGSAVFALGLSFSGYLGALRRPGLGRARQLGSAGRERSGGRRGL